MKDPKTTQGAYMKSLIGCWELVLREDRDERGDRVIDPALGPDPSGLLVYDASGRFSAQFMAKNRSRTADPAPDQATAGENNTRSIAGYDAYFGRFTVDESRHVVTQTLEGALAPDNVGVTVTRQMEVSGDTLKLRLPTTNANGDKIIRTLQWRRCRLPGAQEV